MIRRRPVLTPPVELRRAEQLARLSDTRFDLVVVGGGISGAWVALDAASRGLQVALLEKDDFASGTSSKSSKMVHGGLRYIEQRNLDLVRHSLHERQRLQRNAPHLVQRLPFLFPVLSEDGVFDRRMARAFEALLWAYDALGGWRIGRLHQKLSPSEVRAHCPTLRSEHLVGGFMYFDARADDARLTIAVVRTAAAFGAVVLNGAEVLAVRDDPGRQDVVVELRAGEQSLRVGAGAVVAAGGVWNEHISGVSKPGGRGRIRPAKGVHVFLPWRLLRNDCSVTVVIPGRARRATVTRWGDTVYVGTTDTDYDGSLDDVNCTREELEFLLAGVNRAFDVRVGAEDVVGSCAGLRPLLGGGDGTTSELRRNHEISRNGRILSLTGGKLTTGRFMAEQTVDAVTGLLGRAAPCRTARLELIGGAGYDGEAVTATGGLAAHLGARFGSEAWRVHQLIGEDPSLGEPVVEGLAYVKAEVVFAARHELARSVDDVLSRRTRARLLARDASASAAGEVGRLLAGELGLGTDEMRNQVESYQAAVARERAVLLGEAT